MLNSKEKTALVTAFNNALKFELSMEEIFCYVGGLQKAVDIIGYKFEYDPPHNYWAIDVVEKENENA